jgi:sugar phosphate isomerase/epimerase
MIHIGAVSLGWSGHTLPEVFAQLSEMGGTCIEINGNTERHHSLCLDATAQPQVKAWTAEAGLTINSLSGYCDFAQTDAAMLETEIERLLVTCRVAADMGVPVVRAFTGDTKPGITLAAVRANIIAAFRDACTEAATLGVTLGIENHGRLINDGPALVQLVDEVGADNLGFTVDTGNFAWAGHNLAQVRADFEAVAPRAVNVHIKDGVWAGNDFTFVTAGDGDLPLAWLIETLVAGGYDGTICSEYEGPGDFVSCTANSIKYLKTTLERLQGITYG